MIYSFGLKTQWIDSKINAYLIYVYVYKSTNIDACI